jgi:hypothetical protein
MTHKCLYYIIDCIYHSFSYSICNVRMGYSSCYWYAMNKCLIIPVLILLITACNPTPTVIPLVPPTNSNGPITSPSTSLHQEVIPTTDIQPSPTLVSAPVTSGTLWLQILSPQDEAVVNTPEVDVMGLAAIGAVVSVNDDILIVGDDQQFKTTISLDEGPNLIEIIASDNNGNEMSILLTVTYEP